MRPCLFCDNRLTPGTRPEHIILDALGGRKTSRLLICDDCNNRFGSTIDDALADDVADLRNKLGAPSGTGKRPPLVRYSTPRGTVRQESHARPTLETKPFKITRNGDVVTLELNTYSRRQLVRSLRHAAAQLAIGPRDLIAILKRESAGLTQTYQPVTADQQRLSVGREEALRSIVKSCIELLALAIGNDAVRGAPFDDARRFVTEGGTGSNTQRMELDSRPLPGEEQLRQRFGPAFHLAYVRSDAQGRIFGYFRLYGFVAWRFMLADRSAFADLRTAIIVDPVTRSWSDTIATEVDLPPAWLETVAFDGDLLARNLAQVHFLADRLAREAEIGRIFEEEFDHQGIRGDVVVDDDAIRTELFGTIGDRVAGVFARVPHERTLSWDVVEQWLEEFD